MCVRVFNYTCGDQLGHFVKHPGQMLFLGGFKVKVRIIVRIMFRSWVKFWVQGWV